MTNRIQAAYEKVCQVLLDQRTIEGHWVGRLSDSALATATAVSAFSVFRRSPEKHDLTPKELGQLESLIPLAADWLVAHQNPDGGWGDTDKSLSNVSTTFLVKSALTLADQSGRYTSLDSRISSDEIETIKQRYGDDQTFSVPILTNGALAGLVPWQDIPQLPFELAALPMAWFRFVRMNVVSYAIPALVAIGQVRFNFLPEKGKPFRNFLRRRVKLRTLRLIQEMQPDSGGYLEAAPLTAFVVMSLSAMGLTNHPIVTKGIRFLLQTVRENGSWAIDTNLATWVTSLALSALPTSRKHERAEINWLLSCQHKHQHPFTGASPGGWGWTDLSGAVPDADDTAGALWALATQERGGVSPPMSSTESAIAGINWLLGLQNRDGGIPTFCRGWGMLPFDQSSTDITAHVIRAFQTWRKSGEGQPTDGQPLDDALKHKMQRAEEKMFTFLEKSQQQNGSWVPLWFGNQSMPDDANPYYGTAKVLLALAETKKEATMTHNGLRYLIGSQNMDGSWGNSIEETAVVVEALSEFADRPEVTTVYHRGLSWLLDAVESDRFLQASPIGLYFAKLWYYEDLYPIIFTASALRQALKHTQETKTQEPEV